MSKDSIPYLTIDPAIEEQIRTDREAGRMSPYRFRDEDVARREPNPHDTATIARPAFARDIEKIVNMPAYNRYAGKTQVFSFVENDDICRRGLHVQLVSRVARGIGRLLGLNCDLIEAIALGHDLGHTPFGHAGERFLSRCYHERTDRYFNHNVHSVRVLDQLYRRNVSLQTLDGVLCHNGEFAQQELKRGWKNAKKEPVKNSDLWKRLLEAKKPHDVTFVWVKGHAGHPENERCDALATAAADGKNLLEDTGFTC